MSDPILPLSDAEKKLRKVADDEDELRLDRWFKRAFPDFSHGMLQKLLRTGQIRVDGKRAESSDRLKAGQIIRLPPQLAFAPKDGPKKTFSLSRAEFLRDCVLFEDDDVIVLNKPAGLAVQGGTGLKQNLDDMLMIFSRDGVTKPKLVHRLDRDTSGVLLVARSAFAAAKLAASFRERDTQKIYWACTLGVPNPEEGKIEAPLIRRGEKMEIAASAKDFDAKRAATLYRVEESAKNRVAFVVLWPLTGRTHQLRVHLAHLGTPILGDKVYGGTLTESLPLGELGAGLHLHARRLIIPHPRKGLIDVSAPLGPEMKKTWDWFQFNPKAKTVFRDEDH